MEQEEKGTSERNGVSRDINSTLLRSSGSGDNSSTPELPASNVEQTVNLLRGESSDVLDYFVSTF